MLRDGKTEGVTSTNLPFEVVLRILRGGTRWRGGESSVGLVMRVTVQRSDSSKHLRDLLRVSLLVTPFFSSIKEAVKGYKKNL